MKYFYFGLPLLIALAVALPLGHVLRNAFPQRQEQKICLKKFGPADYFIAALLVISAIAMGGMLGYLLLTKYISPVSVPLFFIACWMFGEGYYRISLKLFQE